MKREKKKVCFIITPIGPTDSITRRKVNGLIDEVIEPVLSDLGYAVVVSHRITDSGTMTAAIIRNVYHADLAIANLTGNNPNVMYEVALRHACAKPIIHITEDVSSLPFDINDQRTIEYMDDMHGAHELKEKLYEMVKNISNDGPVSNPITDALEKKNLVNIPEESTIEINSLLTLIQNEIKDIRREMTILRRSGDGEVYPRIKAKYVPDDELFKIVSNLSDKEQIKYLGKAANGVFIAENGKLDYIPKVED